MPRPDAGRSRHADPDQLPKHMERERLLEVVDALTELLHVVRRLASGHQDEPTRKTRIVLKVSEDLAAIAGHVHIGQYDIESVLRREYQRGLCGLRRLDRMAVASEESRKSVENGRLVIRNEYPEGGVIAVGYLGHEQELVRNAERANDLKDHLPRLVFPSHSIHHLEWNRAWHLSGFIEHMKPPA